MLEGGNLSRILHDVYEFVYVLFRPKHLRVTVPLSADMTADLAQNC